VLLAVDDFQALYCKTLYRDSNFGTIKPYHLSMPRLILEYASGRKSFVRSLEAYSSNAADSHLRFQARGAVVGAISSDHTLFQLPIELREALGLPYEKPTGPYVKRSAEMVEYTRGLKALPVPDRLSVEEAATMFEVWKDDNGLNAREYLTLMPFCLFVFTYLADGRDEYFIAKYSEASGNARDLVRVGLRKSLET
jgi:small subunit ribosomal protein S29